MRHGFIVTSAIIAMIAISVSAQAQMQTGQILKGSPRLPAHPTGEKETAAPPSPARPIGSTIRYEMLCSPPRSVEEASACASEASVDAAERANVINIVGGLLLLTSLGASAAALIYSVRATRAAERQAGHAETATEVTLRAYLGIEKVDLVWSRDGKVAFDVWIKNSGQTPARYFELAGLAGVTALGAKLPIRPIEGPFVRWLQIGRDQTLSARLHPMNDEEIQEGDVVNTSKVIYVTGLLRYEDIFGKVWTETFKAFRWSPNGVRQKMSFAAIRDEAPGMDLLDD